MYMYTRVRKVAEANSWGAGGTFLDLGAHFGMWCSNSKLLEEVYCNTNGVFCW